MLSICELGHLYTNPLDFVAVHPTNSLKATCNMQVHLWIISRLPSIVLADKTLFIGMVWYVHALITGSLLHWFSLSQVHSSKCLFQYSIGNNDKERDRRSKGEAFRASHQKGIHSLRKLNDSASNAIKHKNKKTGKLVGIYKMKKIRPSGPEGTKSRKRAVQMRFPQKFFFLRFRKDYDW